MIHSMLLPAVLAVCVHSAQEDPTPQGPQPLGMPNVIMISGIRGHVDHKAVQGENAKFYDNHQYGNPNGIYVKANIDELKALNPQCDWGVYAAHQECYVQLKNFGSDGVPGHYLCVHKVEGHPKYWQLSAMGEWQGVNPSSPTAHKHTRGRGMIKMWRSNDITGVTVTLPSSFPLGINGLDYCKISPVSQDSLAWTCSDPECGRKEQDASTGHCKCGHKWRAKYKSELLEIQQNVMTMISPSKIKKSAQQLYQHAYSLLGWLQFPLSTAKDKPASAKIMKRLQGEQSEEKHSEADAPVAQPGAQVPQDEEKTSEAAPVARAPAPRQDVGDEKEEEGVPASPVGAQVEGQMSNPPAAQQGENFAPGAPGAEENDGMPGRVLERTEPEGTD